MSERRIAEEAERESRRRLQQSSQLEQSVSVGISGPPQLRRGERSAFLGQFPEHVLKAATYSAIKGKSIPGELRAALADRRCDHVYLAADVVSQVSAILGLVKERNLPVTIVYSPEFRSDTAVVLTTSDINQQDDIWVGR